MFDIKVTSLGDAYDTFDIWGTKMIGLFDPDARPIERPNYHVEFFHDIDGDLHDYVKPEPHHIIDIFSFASTFKEDDKIIVHCFAGVSRSTAIAIAILCLHGMSPINAVEHINKIRDCMWPNSLIIKIADELLNFNGELIKAVSDWKSKNKRKIYVPFSDEENRKNSEKVKDMMKDLIGKIQW